MLTLLLGTALAAPVQLVTGVRDASSTRGTVDGPRLGARYTFGPAAVEVAGFFNPLSARVDGLDETLVVIAHAGDANVQFQQPVRNDLAGGSLLIDYGFLKLGEEEDFSGGPHLYAGLDLSLQREYFAVYDEERASSGASPVSLIDAGGGLVVGPVLGAGADIWIKGRVGVRATWMRRFYRQRELQYDPNQPATGRALVSEPIRGLELLVQL